MRLAEYVLAHTVTGECTCGKCFDSKDIPDPAKAVAQASPPGHTVDMFFFKMTTRGEPDADTLKELIRQHKGEFCDIDILNGDEHGYIDVGGWIGDQQLALRLMGLGQLVGLWDILTSHALPVPDELKQQMAGMGMVCIRPCQEVREQIATLADAVIKNHEG